MVQEQENTRGYKQITNGQLQLIKEMLSWELSKTIENNRIKPKYSTDIKHIMYSKFRNYLELWTMKKPTVSHKLT